MDTKPIANILIEADSIYKSRYPERILREIFKNEVKTFKCQLLTKPLTIIQYETDPEIIETQVSHTYKRNSKFIRMPKLNSERNKNPLENSKQLIRKDSELLYKGWEEIYFYDLIYKPLMNLENCHKYNYLSKCIKFENKIYALLNRPFISPEYICSDPVDLLLAIEPTEKIRNISTLDIPYTDEMIETGNSIPKTLKMDELKAFTKPSAILEKFNKEKSPTKIPTKIIAQFEESAFEVIYQDPFVIYPYVKVILQPLALNSSKKIDLQTYPPGFSSYSIGKTICYSLLIKPIILIDSKKLFTNKDEIEQQSMISTTIDITNKSIISTTIDCTNKSINEQKSFEKSASFHSFSLKYSPKVTILNINKDNEYENLSRYKKPTCLSSFNIFIKPIISLFYKESSSSNEFIQEKPKKNVIIQESANAYEVKYEDPITYHPFSKVVLQPLTVSLTKITFSTEISTELNKMPNIPNRKTIVSTEDSIIEIEYYDPKVYLIDLKVLMQPIILISDLQTSSIINPEIISKEISSISYSPKVSLSEKSKVSENQLDYEIKYSNIMIYKLSPKIILQPFVLLSLKKDDRLKEIDKMPESPKKQTIAKIEESAFEIMYYDPEIYLMQNKVIMHPITLMSNVSSIINDKINSPELSNKGICITDKAYNKVSQLMGEQFIIDVNSTSSSLYKPFVKMILQPLIIVIKKPVFSTEINEGTVISNKRSIKETSMNIKYHKPKIYLINTKVVLYPILLRSSIVSSETKPIISYKNPLNQKPQYLQNQECYEIKENLSTKYNLVTKVLIQPLIINVAKSPQVAKKMKKIDKKLVRSGKSGKKVLGIVEDSGVKIDYSDPIIYLIDIKVLVQPIIILSDVKMSPFLKDEISTRERLEIETQHIESFARIIPKKAKKDLFESNNEVSTIYKPSTKMILQPLIVSVANKIFFSTEIFTELNKLPNGSNRKTIVKTEDSKIEIEYYDPKIYLIDLKVLMQPVILISDQQTFSMINYDNISLSISYSPEFSLNEKSKLPENQLDLEIKSPNTMIYKLTPKIVLQPLLLSLKQEYPLKEMHRMPESPKKQIVSEIEGSAFEIIHYDPIIYLMQNKVIMHPITITSNISSIVNPEIKSNTNILISDKLFQNIKTHNILEINNINSAIYKPFSKMILQP